MRTGTSPNTGYWRRKHEDYTQDEEQDKPYLEGKSLSLYE